MIQKRLKQKNKLISESQSVQTILVNILIIKKEINFYFYKKNIIFLNKIIKKFTVISFDLFLFLLASFTAESFLRSILPVFSGGSWQRSQIKFKAETKQSFISKTYLSHISL